MTFPQLYTQDPADRRRYTTVPHPLAGVDGQILITAAVRYVLGGASYAPGSVMDWIDAHPDCLSDNTLHTVLRDVVRWLAECRPGDDGTDLSYRKDWTAFALHRLQAQPPAFRQAVVRAALTLPEQRCAQAAQPFMVFWEAA